MENNKKQIIITLEVDTMSMTVTNLTQIEIIGLLTHFKESVHLDMLKNNEGLSESNNNKNPK